MKRIVFFDFEIKSMASLPPALEALADYHSYQETLADASGFTESSELHRKRRIELREAAKFIQAAHDDGYDPEFED